MGKYLVLWELDYARIPADAKERDALLLGMVETVKATFKKGRMKDGGFSSVE